MNAKRLIKKSEFAKLANTSPANITKLCKSRLAPAVSGKYIDAAAPAAKEYLEARRKVSTQTVPKQAKTPDKPTPKPAKPLAPIGEEDPFIPIDIPEDIAAFSDMTLREILIRFGTHSAFEGWLKASKTIEDLREKRFKNAVAEGDYIERDLVSKHIVALIDSTLERLLSDAPKAISRQLKTAAVAKLTLEEMEAATAKILSSQLRDIKERSLRGLRNAKH